MKKERSGAHAVGRVLTTVEERKDEACRSTATRAKIKFYYWSYLLRTRISISPFICVYCIPVSDRDSSLSRSSSLSPSYTASGSRQILTALKIAIFVSIVVSGWVVLFGETGVKGPMLTSAMSCTLPQPELHEGGMPAYVNMHVDSTADCSTQLPHSKSSILTRAGPTSTTPSTSSVTRPLKLDVCTAKQMQSSKDPIVVLWFSV